MKSSTDTVQQPLGQRIEPKKPEAPQPQWKPVEGHPGYRTRTVDGNQEVVGPQGFAALVGEDANGVWKHLGLSNKKG
jgi:hypothetical protein